MRFFKILYAHAQYDVNGLVASMSRKEYGEPVLQLKCTENCNSTKFAVSTYALIISLKFSAFLYLL